MPSPDGGTKTNRPKIIAAVVLSPNFELPGPAIIIKFQFWLTNSSATYNTFNK